MRLTGRLRRRPSIPALSRPGDPRDLFIARVAAGKSFCDVGGLWGVTSEKVTVAHAAGATRVAMIDITTEGGELWRSFHDRLASKRITGVECISGDVHSLSLPEPFDVVHCSGVIYHSPNPVATLTALRGIAAQWMILTSVVIPPTIENDAGSMTFADGQILFLPHADERTLAIVRSHFRGSGVAAEGIHTDIGRWPLVGTGDTYAPWWWLFTTAALHQMIETCGFRIEKEAPTWGGKAHTFLSRCV